MTKIENPETDPYLWVMDTYRRTMDAHGWALVGVFADEDDDGPAFTYTTGLTRLGVPELVLTGAEPCCAAAPLNGLARRLRDGWRPDAGPGAVHDVLGAPVVLMPVPPAASAEHLLVAHDFFDTPTFTLSALQVVRADAEGRWPWDDDALAAAQPMLFDPPC